MSAGPGLTGDRNFETSVEYHRIGDATRTVVYGRDRDEVIAMIQAAHGTDYDWEWTWVVTERRVPMGLGPMWARVARGFDEYL